MTHKQNYMARIEQNKQNRLATGLLSERFPEVSDMVIHMTYYQKGANPVLMQRTVNISPRDFAYFNMECMIKGCIDGGFDLTPVITTLIKGHKKSGKGKLVCCGKTDIPAPDHASVAYEIEIQYNKGSR